MMGRDKKLKKGDLVAATVSVKHNRWRDYKALDLN